MKLSYALSTLLIAVECGVLSACTGYVPGAKAYWDTKVKEMCEKDGGVKVFEAAYLTKDEYDLLVDRFGRLAPPLEDRASPYVPIFRTSTTTYIRDADPAVWRHETKLVRRSDHKVLGISVTYSRVGGDAPGPWHPSHFSCPEKPGNLFAEAIRRRTGEQ